MIHEHSNVHDILLSYLQFLYLSHIQQYRFLVKPVVSMANPVDGIIKERRRVRRKKRKEKKRKEKKRKEKAIKDVEEM